MTDLNKLRDQQNRETILLAELAGLLHNIGKLDPNFLAAVVRDKDESKAKQEISEHLLDIQEYNYERFASPDISLLQEDIQQLIVQTWKTRDSLTSVLKTRLSDQSDTEFVAKSLKSIWQFYNFRIKVNGPLYLPLQQERSDLQSQNHLYKQINQQLEQLAVELKRATDKKNFGNQYEQKKKEQQDIKDKLDNLRRNTYLLERTKQEKLEDSFRAIKLAIANESWSLIDLLSLFWDDFFSKPDPKNDQLADYKRESALKPWLSPKVGVDLLKLLILAHGEISGAEKNFSPSKSVEGVKAPWKAIQKATAFGYGFTNLEWLTFIDKRYKLINEALITAKTPVSKRDDFLEIANLILEMGLGDTQWPLNEINLWDYASTIATLFKSAVAKAIIEGKIPDLADIRWRFVSIRYDGLEYLSRAQHISDLLARQDLLTQALDTVQAVIEVELPLGNEIYRDENGSVLIVPHVSMGRDKEEIDLLNLSPGNGSTVETLHRLLTNRFAQAGESPLAGELVPMIALSQPVRGKEIRLDENVPGWLDFSFKTDIEIIDKIWGTEGAVAQICTVCGVRPQGFGDKDWERHQREKHTPGQKPLECEVCKAQDRSVCQPCESRRQDRSKAWATNPEKFAGTIWTDEIADENGRLALIVGRFELDGWLDGKLIPSMQKPASFARIRRCWETTRTFWKQTSEDLAHLVGGKYRDRLIIYPQNPNQLKRSRGQGLGPYHAYELDIDGRNMSVIWDVENGRLISADNLDYVGKQFSDTEVLEKLIKKGQQFSLYESSSYQRGKKKVIDIEIDRVESSSESYYSPVLPILAEPSTFMALVPARKAMQVVEAIRKKYELEMARVRDRLSLHVGVVFAPRRTPIRAVLEAGRNMLSKKLGQWQRWSVETPGWELIAKSSNRSINWPYPAFMDEDQTQSDCWYPHLSIVDPAKDVLNNNGDSSDAQPDKFVHVTKLNSNQEIYIRTATFDFEFLDTAGRRFEIAYDENGRRLGQNRQQRPYLLDDLLILEDAWKTIGCDEGLTNNQIYALRDTIRAKREEWQPARDDCQPHTGSFWLFCRDVLRNADWKQPSNDKINRLTDWAVSGLLEDVIELRMSIMKEKPERTQKQEEQPNYE
jgi:hypothetical protein